MLQASSESTNRFMKTFLCVKARIIHAFKTVLINEERFAQYYLKFTKHATSCLEIGGPSSVFEYRIPIYRYLKSMHLVNYSSDTVWDSQLNTSAIYLRKMKKVHTIVGEATSLPIATSSFDIALSSHQLEHTANPLKELFEIQRVLKSGGILMIVVPNKHATFDNTRPFTLFSHLLDDYNNEINENDSTHIPEALDSLDSLGMSTREREDHFTMYKNNSANRAIHHHVFSIDVLTESLLYCGFEILHTAVSGINIYCLAKKAK